MIKKKKQKIVCLGGGNAMPKGLLEGLKKEDVEITVVCAMLDSGGSSGRLREDYGILSPGDIRRAFITLANTSPVVEELFNFRFQGGEFKGHNFANLFIAALELSTKNPEKAFQEMNKILNTSHEVLPATIEKSKLCALMEDGTVVKGETNIDIPKHDGRLKIKKVFLEPKVKGYPQAVKAIYNADKVVIGPGDLYSTIAQILLAEGISEAILKTKARSIYICNLMAKHGETRNFSVENFTQEVEKILKGELEKVIYHNIPFKKERVEKYKKKHPELLSPVVFKGKNDEKFFGADVALSFGEVVHDPKKLSKIILQI